MRSRGEKLMPSFLVGYGGRKGESVLELFERVLTIAPINLKEESKL
jgi:hypothetical protein